MKGWGFAGDKPVFILFPTHPVFLRKSQEVILLVELFHLINLHLEMFIAP
jgi:hypothetical protein